MEQCPRARVGETWPSVGLVALVLWQTQLLLDFYPSVLVNLNPPFVCDCGRRRRFPLWLVTLSQVCFAPFPPQLGTHKYTILCAVPGPEDDASKKKKEAARKKKEASKNADMSLPNFDEKQWSTYAHAFFERVGLH